MAFPRKPYKHKAKGPRNTTVIFSSLHGDVKNALSDHAIFPKPWFNLAGGDDDAIQDYPTHVMGHFECRNESCAKKGWGSKKIAIVIRQYHSNGYNAPVYKQRCKSCNKLGFLRLDENSYVDRVVFRLKKWAGIPTEAREYNVGSSRAPHETKLCEACRAGRCRESRLTCEGGRERGQRQRI